MKKYNVFKNAKTLTGLLPGKYETSVLLIALFVGLYFYQYHQEATSILGYASMVIWMILGHFICWFIHFCIHTFICYKRKVNFYGKAKDDDNESNNI